MRLKLLLTGIFIVTALITSAQKQDTVIVNLAKTSKIIFTVEDPDDLEVLKHYDFEKLFEDILIKIEQKKNGIEPDADSADSLETATEAEPDSTFAPSENESEVEGESDEYRRWREERDAGRSDNDRNYDDNDDEDSDDQNEDWRDHRWNRTWQAFNTDLGLNNYLEREKLPFDNDLHSVRPWGSWYIAISSIQRSRIAKNFFLEWGLGMSWYNFKFQKDNVMLAKDEFGVEFVEDTRDVDFKKSKLSISYIQASLIPVVDFGDHGRKPRFWDGYTGNSFRIGLGPYIAYRIGSHTKMVYNDDGREKDRERDGYYLNTFRYGMRLQVGYRSTDLFFNYDLNELFQENRGPKLNAFSFGVIF
jgi:hypothetical protein